MGKVKRKLRPIKSLTSLQQDVAIHFQQRWPDRSDWERSLQLPFYRIVRVSGRIASALLDDERDELIDPDVGREDLRRSIGQMVVVLTEFSSRNGWSIENIVQEYCREAGIQEVVDEDEGDDSEDDER